MPRTITSTMVRPVDDQHRRSSALSRWRLVLAGAGVALELAFGTAAWAGTCTGASPSPGCTCRRMSVYDNVWDCPDGRSCAPAMTGGGYNCAKGLVVEPGQSGSGGSSGTDTGSGTGGAGVPGKKPRGTAK